MQILVLLVQRNTEILSSINVTTNEIRLDLINLVHQLVEPARSDDLDENSDRDERDACATEYAHLEDLQQGDSDDLSEDEGIEAVAKDTAIDEASAVLEPATVVDVRELDAEVSAETGVSKSERAYLVLEQD